MQFRRVPALAVASIAPTATAMWTLFRLVEDADPSVAEMVWVEGLDPAERATLGTTARGE